ncbi:hypothetical protein DFJ58DRAFT_727601 [Suillus subalutaceus]|uniref:uncharacterized protein n=1 Tax=Suillus subalutaceus TaxID=48586 RepID=UPI001B85EFAE|nr:uncharacterized protein DFJ58DRAFT_727601 [Suillus subalutaceus]KAG1855166.1 hypothetical protein DFJ58DRAFT_727601 [Suillus subalutaceus]
MHACITPPPSSVGQPSPTRDTDEPRQLRPVQNLCSPFRDSRMHHDIQSTKTQSKHTTTYPRQLSPSSDDTSNDSSLEDELRALPSPPSGIMRNLSRLVTRAQRQFKPYDPHHSHAPNAIELRLVHRSVGKYASETEMSLPDVQEGKDIFERGLRGMSHKTVTQAVIAKQATRESMRLRVLTTTWEIEANLQRIKLLESILEQNAHEYARSIADASYFQRYLAGGNKQELEASMDFSVGAHSHDLASFVVTDTQLDHIQALARKLCLPEEAPVEVVKGQSSNSDC